MTKLLLIGGDSYLGLSLLKEILSQFNIAVVSRKKTNIENEYVIRDLENIPNHLYEQCDVVFSLIGLAHVKEKGNSLKFFNVNKDLVLSIANKCKQFGVKRFIQMSSLSVYGDKPYIDINTKEEPKTSYGLSKFEADQELLKLDSPSFNVLLIRPPMIYGPGAPGNWHKLIGLVGNFIFLPFGNLNNQRTFLHIDNFILYIKNLIMTSDEPSGVKIITDPFNLSVSEIVRSISSSTNKRRFLIDYRLFSYLIQKISKPLHQRLFGDLIVVPSYKCSKLLLKNHVLKKLI